MSQRDHEPSAQESEDSLIDQVIDDRYHITGKLGAGGVGVVYEAEHVKLRRSVAVKVLQREYAAKKSLRKRFEREARAMGALEHPNIVKVTDFGVWSDLPFLVMELLEGRSLKERITAGALSAGEVSEIGCDVLRAAAFAHESGLVHRDLKPGNVFLAERSDGNVHVSILDFGLAKFVTHEGGAEGTPKLTVTGMAFGTPAYMAPEQAAGGQTDHRTDLYSIGVMLFEMITGSLPFRGASGEMMRQHLFATPPRLAELFHASGRRVSDGLEAFFEKAFAKERSRRFQSASEMRAAFEKESAALAELLDTGVLGQATADTIFAGQGDATPPTIADDAVTTSATVPGVPLAFASTDPADIDAATKPSRSSTGSRMWWIIIGGAVVFVAFVGAAIALWLAAHNDASDGASPDVVPRARIDAPRGNHDGSTKGRAAPTRSEPLKNVETVGVGHGNDIWVEPQPALIAEAKTRVDSGGTIDEGLAHRLLAHAWRNKEDARPLLLLARYRLSRGHLTDAVDRYEKAFAADPRARNDPNMLRDLVELSKSRSVGWRAARDVQNIYGQGAIPAVDEALHDSTNDAQESRRLQKLRNELNDLRR